jgi:predicted DCC family thiol-disulfide oxidoreductase YuxK
MHDTLIQGTVVYDGTCGVCKAFMDYVNKKDDGSKLEIIAYQLADLNRISPGLTENMANRAMYFVREDGTRFGGARGVYEMLKRLPGLWGILGAAMAIPTLSILSEPFYRAFASNRHYVSGKMGLRECIITKRNETSENR